MRRRHVPTLLAVAGLSLLTALWAGLYRSGWPLALLREHWPLAHGPLLVGGFLGTLIGLEKASAVERWWGYLAPGFAAAAAVSLLLRTDPSTAGLLFSFAGGFLLLNLSALLLRRPDQSGILMLAGAAAWTVGNLLWLAGRSLPTVASWWLAFPLLTIVGERLELSRIVVRSRRARIALLAALGLYITGLGMLFWSLDVALRIQGLAMILLAVWLLRNDLARVTLRSPGVHRYTACCLLLGFTWLAVAGGMAAAWGTRLSGLRYDALMHALLLGFVFGMIFGHAPIIAPMLFGRRLAFNRFFYVPLLLLQASLALRVASDLAAWLPGRAWGALLNVVALLAFLATAVRAGTKMQ